MQEVKNDNGKQDIEVDENKIMDEYKKYISYLLDDRGEFCRPDCVYQPKCVLNKFKEFVDQYGDKCKFPEEEVDKALEVGAKKAYDKLLSHIKEGKDGDKLLDRDDLIRLANSARQFLWDFGYIYGSDKEVDEALKVGATNVFNELLSRIREGKDIVKLRSYIFHAEMLADLVDKHNILSVYEEVKKAINAGVNNACKEVKDRITKGDINAHTIICFEKLVNEYSDQLTRSQAEVEQILKDGVICAYNSCLPHINDDFRFYEDCMKLFERYGEKYGLQTPKLTTEKANAYVKMYNWIRFKYFR